MSTEKPFAKLYDLPDGAQVLYYLDIAEEAKLVQRTEVNGIAIEVNPGFKTHKAARVAFDEVTLEQAQAFRTGVILMMDEYFEL